MFKKIMLVTCSILIAILSVVFLPMQRANNIVYADESVSSTFAFNSRNYSEMVTNYGTNSQLYSIDFFFNFSTDTSVVDSYGNYPFYVDFYFIRNGGSTLPIYDLSNDESSRQYYSFGNLNGYKSQSDYGYTYYSNVLNSANRFYFGVNYFYSESYNSIRFNSLTYRCIQPWDSDGDVDTDNYTCYTDVAYSYYAPYCWLSQYIFLFDGSISFVIEVLSSYRLGNSVFNVPRSYSYFLVDSSNSYYQSGYNAGLVANQTNIYNQGYSAGDQVGYNRGYNVGYTDGSNGQHSFLALITAVIDAPVTYVTSLLNFELLGFNMFDFITALFTISVILTIIRFITGKTGGDT